MISTTTRRAISDHPWPDRVEQVEAADRLQRGHVPQVSRADPEETEAGVPDPFWFAGEVSELVVDASPEELSFPGELAGGST